ncbi:MAG: alpha/beta hydrolase [Deltaproteobacteria bacterium]|nr:alpha/beta hydrolase [Deltaproteobacteria bacterium]
MLPIVLLPGLDGTGRMFRRFVDAAPPGFAPRVVSYPSHEVRSYAGLEPIAEAALPTSRPFVLLGESFGGPLSIRIAAKRPPGLVALVLVATFARAPVPAWLARFRPWVHRSLFSFPPPAPVLRRLLAGWDADAELIAEFQASSASVSPAVLAARVRAVLEVDATADLGRCPVPVLYLRAKREALLRPDLAEELKSHRPELHLADVDTAHLVLQRDPRAAWRHIEAFDALIGFLDGSDDEWCECWPTSA